MAHLSEDARPDRGVPVRARTSTRSTASRVFGVDAGDVTAAMRAKIKAMNYGLAYGLSALRPVASSWRSTPPRRAG